MPFTVEHIEEEGEHCWAVVSCACDLENDDDQLVTHTVQAVREAYGEKKIIDLASSLVPDPEVATKFNLTAILAAVRRGMPNPAAEGGKPAHLTNYRSEACEMVAKGALKEAYDIEFPVAPQQGKTNANQPILGFDHWGILHEGSITALTLVQVKGTEEKKVPPAVADALADECAKVPEQIDEICRTLAMVVLALEDGVIQTTICGMLEALGDEKPIEIAVAPVIVRGGETGSTLDDLQPCRTAAVNFGHIRARGATVYISAKLADFGKTVMKNARAA